mmetsp:Transcript_843/g.1716  ORF Transcript_843/g.1716 Transcript_843/m.1716 type:complete len:88 (+) Transcript_843:87-350(+)
MNIVSWDPEVSCSLLDSSKDQDNSMLVTIKTKSTWIGAKAYITNGVKVESIRGTNKTEGAVATAKKHRIGSKPNFPVDVKLLFFKDG